MTDRVHHYATELSWSGSTGVGYDAYDRRHLVTSAPAARQLELASDPAFLGDPHLLNPEQLLLAAASSCQLLSFLAVAARARLNVVGYTDSARAEMDEADRPTRITSISLHPVITLTDTDRPRPTEQRLAKLADIAHHECFIANTLNAAIVLTSEFGWTG